MTPPADSPRPTSVQEGDRWSAYDEQSGIRRVWHSLDPAALRRFSIFAEFKDSFLETITPDISVAEWEAGAVLFEEGTYLDLAFFVAEGTVDLVLKKLDQAPTAPIFGATSTDPQATAFLTRPPPRDERAEITYLASADFDLAGGERAELKEGDFFGEIGALNGWPQSVTATTTSICTLVQIRLPALRQIKRKSKALRKQLDDAYRSRTLDRQLRTTPLLASCSPEMLEALARKVELTSLEPGESLAEEGALADSVYLV
ncbi:MAG: hypothetical protein HKO53_18110, partial [Gemmatimonadetes bacterium]|nr:hypothetical protein [Gemmatimonadota bacterium]